MKHTNDVPACPSCEEKLKLADPAIADWFRACVKPSFPTAHISWSYRDEASQRQAFAEGKSKLPYPHSAHNKSPARALDLFELSSNGMASWAFMFFKKISDLNHPGVSIVWGGVWKVLGDFDHFELVSNA